MSKTVKDVVKMIDRAYELDREMKARKKELDALKDDIKSTASKLKLTKLEGKKAVAIISGSTLTSISPEDLYNCLRDSGYTRDRALRAFFDLVSVKISDTKKYLGEALMDTIAKKESKPYSRVSVKSK